ncbi:early secretory antigenic target protein ESAT-6 [Antricoccus suffuscus]|uniref:Early secretory antigenic target protein ESAT-6 n=1 Tax=Antricoccus suffuscus TaxID=1629062 RepID=A0A2T0ZZQ5_9ACTN|nr:WXG100 family type VII secretion target [Antricoccus suffuscus]PRZ41764.1 early secretory antigenic target protein ESAT-6 [Antricoccus suffuscus]
MFNGDGTYHVNWDDQHTAAASVGTGIGALDSTLGDVNTEVNTLTAGWDSEAKEAYSIRQKEWTTASDHIKEALLQFKTGLTEAAGLSSGSEKKNIGTVGSG